MQVESVKLESFNSFISSTKIFVKVSKVSKVVRLKNYIDSSYNTREYNFLAVISIY